MMKAWGRLAVPFSVSVLMAMTLAGCSGGTSSGSSGAAPSASASVSASVSTSASVSASVSAGSRSLTVSSSAFAQNASIPEKYSCTGAQVSPQLSWSGVPAGTAQVAVVVLDPDAGNFVHWVLSGIAPTTTSIAEGKVPAGTTVIREYSPMCPPAGVHHYTFTVYALSRSPGVSAASEANDAIGRIKAAATMSGELTGTFGS